MTVQYPDNKYHPYLCWLDRLWKISRRARLALLHAAVEQNLFSEEGTSAADPQREPVSAERMNLPAAETAVDRFSREKILPAAAEPFSAEGILPGSGAADGPSFAAGIRPTAAGAAEPFSAEGILPGSGAADGPSFAAEIRPTAAEAEEVFPSEGTLPASGAADELLSEGARVLYTASESFLHYLCGEVFPGKVKAGEAARMLLAARKQDPERIVEELMRENIRFACILEPEYPSRLRTIPDPPFGIYWKGSLPEDTDPAAAVIGARLASGYGREQARRYARRLGKEGITVISGMARGIDGIAQTAALDAGGSSCAVLGCGVDICYPRENRALYDRLLHEGGILSEYPPGTPPAPKLFPPRNRIISGLADLVLVIEARRKSGTLITVDMALEQGREVYALPGRVSDSLSDGCNRLIRQGAGAATCPEDLLEFFFGTGQQIHNNTANRTVKPPAPSGTADQKAKPPAPSDTGHQKAKPPAPSGTADQTEKENEKTHPLSLAPSDTAILRRQKKEQSPLESAILKTLSHEDEIHLERILENVNRILTAAEIGTTDLTALVPALMRLKIDGKIQEETAGYYRRSGVSEDSSIH